jgi:hypothetical protein
MNPGPSHVFAVAIPMHHLLRRRGARPDGSPDGRQVPGSLSAPISQEVNQSDT